MNPRPRYLQIPMAILDNTKLQPLDGQVYAVIYWYAQMSKQKCFASNEQIAGVLTYGERKINPTSVANSVSRLAKEGCVQVLLTKNNRRTEIIPLVIEEVPDDYEAASSNDEAEMFETTSPSSNNEGEEVTTLTASSNDDRELKVASSNDESEHHQTMKPASSNDEENKNIEQEDINNNSSYEELQRLAAEAFGDEVHVEKKHENPDTLRETLPRPELLEGEVAELPKAKPKKPKREPNPDGSYGKPEINELRIYFLKAMGISREGCTREKSGRYWKLLLQSVKTGENKVDIVKGLIDLASKNNVYWRIASPVDLYYKLPKLEIERNNKGVKIGVAQDTPIEQDKQGVKIGVYYANQ